MRSSRSIKVGLSSDASLQLISRTMYDVVALIVVLYERGWIAPALYCLSKAENISVECDLCDSSLTFLMNGTKR
jgi:hypothetical protein